MKVKKKMKKTISRVNAVIPDNWILLLPAGISVREMKEALQGDHPDIEIWPEAGILEIIVADKLSIDIEKAEEDFKDAEVRHCAEEKSLPSVFYLTLKTEGYEAGLPFIKKLINAFGGLLLGDTEDLMPRVEADRV